MNLLDLIVLTFAAQMVIDVWRNGDIFADLRAYFEARMDGCDYEVPEDDEEPTAEQVDLVNSMAEFEEQRGPLWMRLLNRCCPNWLCHLLTCSYCLTVQVPIWLTVFFIVPSLFCDWHGWLITAAVCKLPLYVFAAARFGFLFNESLPYGMQYERDREVSKPNGS